MEATQETLKTAASPFADGLNWSADLHTGDGRMDHTHEEFVSLLNAVLITPQTEQLNLYREFLNHTVAHFEQEDRWMLATGFTQDNCHAGQHATILQTMRAVETHYVQGDTALISRLCEALAEWFPGHAASMDAGLAQHLKSVNFDTETETLADPSVIQSVTMSGCGSVSCS